MKDPDAESLDCRTNFFNIYVPLTDGQASWVLFAEADRLGKCYGREVLPDEVMRRALNHYIVDVIQPLWALET